MKVSVTTDDGEVVEIYHLPAIQLGQPDARTRALREAADLSEVGMDGTEGAECANCPDPIHEDDNGAGGKVWVHDFGSTVCHDDPPGSLEAGDTTTVAEPKP